MKLKLTIAYDGRDFAGWQSQTDGKAVQDVLEAAVRKIEGDRVVVHGAGRTDAGVHAEAQIAHMEVNHPRLKPADWLGAINAHLPPTLRVMKVARASDAFHARFSATGKIYRYTIYDGSVLPPHHLGWVWAVPRALDDAAMRETAGLFVGRHNFSAFTANRGGPPPDPHRLVHSVEMKRRGHLLTLTFKGEGFLYKMVRMLAGSIVRVGLGKESVESMAARLHDAGPRWNHVAPAEGLCLQRVLYGKR